MIGIILGSDSDRETMLHCLEKLDDMNIGHEMKVSILNHQIFKYSSKFRLKLSMFSVFITWHLEGDQ